MVERRITSLKVQKKNPNRVSIYLDEEFAFGVTRIVAAWLHVGQELTDEKIAELQDQETNEAALQKALLLLSYRPRSEAEIRQKMKKGGFDPEVITKVLDRLRETGLVRDESFARDWVENRSALRPRSRKMLAYELRQKGVAEEAIEQALETTSEDEGLAFQAATRYAHKLSAADWQEFHRRLMSFLARRGFSYETANTVVRQVWQEHQSDDGDIRYPDNEET
jgi:regulatory protein